MPLEEDLARKLFGDYDALAKALTSPIELGVEHKFRLLTERTESLEGAILELARHIDQLES